MPILVRLSSFDRISVPTHSLPRHGCPEQPGPGEKTYENRIGLLAALPSVRCDLHTRFSPPRQINWFAVAIKFALGLILVGNLLAPFAARAQNLGTAPAFGQAVQGQQATTVEGTVLNIVNWGCNVIAPVIAVACLGVAGWHFKSGRGYLGWGVSGVALMVISGLGRMAEGFITQAQGIQ